MRSNPGYRDRAPASNLFRFGGPYCKAALGKAPLFSKIAFQFVYSLQTNGCMLLRVA